MGQRVKVVFSPEVFQIRDPLRYALPILRSPGGRAEAWMSVPMLFSIEWIEPSEI
jgi:hypothetical protein